MVMKSNFSWFQLAKYVRVNIKMDKNPLKTNLCIQAMPAMKIRSKQIDKKV